jgi:hypothetical protein
MVKIHNAINLQGEPEIYFGTGFFHGGTVG